MDNFTADQVKASTLLVCEQLILDAVFDSWTIGIQDEDEFKYYWKDEDSVHDISAALMAQAIGDYLVASVVKKVISVVTVDHPELDSVKTNLASYPLPA